jgi:putative transposase
MPNFRRIFRPGGTYFFTLVTHLRRPFLCSGNARACLRTALDACQTRWPFTLYAIVLLPDHLHTIWVLPPGDCSYSRRIAFIKQHFTRNYLSSGLAESRVTAAQSRQRRRGVFQPRFWEHTVRDEDDLERRLNYLHFNPVKHRHCIRPHDWPYSSFHRFVRQNIYPIDWRCPDDMIASNEWQAIGNTAGE